jgi:hypothetical protein
MKGLDLLKIVGRAGDEQFVFHFAPDGIKRA